MADYELMEVLARAITYGALPTVAGFILYLSLQVAPRDRFPLYVAAAACVLMMVLCAIHL